MIAVTRLVPKVPEQNTLVVAKGSEQVFHVLFQFRIEGGSICAQRNRRILYPTGIVNTGFRVGLLAIARLGVPTIVEDAEERSDSMVLTDGEEVAHAFLHTFGIVFIYHTAEVNAQRSEAQVFGPG